MLDISGAVPPARLSHIFEICRKADFSQMQAAVDDLLADGYPVAQLLSQMFDALISPEMGFTTIQMAKVRCTLLLTVFRVDRRGRWRGRRAWVGTV